MKKIIFLPMITLLIVSFSLLSISTVAEENQDYVCSYMSYLPPRTIPRDAFASNPPQAITDNPSSFSWTTYKGQDWTTPAKYQGSCGSCWAFAAVAAIEAQINIQHDNPDLDIDLSEQYILSCLPSAGTCLGGWPDQAFRRILDTSRYGNYVNGIVTESCFPYATSSSIPCLSKCSDWQDNLWEIEAYGVVKFPTYDTESLKTLLIERGPLTSYSYTDTILTSWGRTHNNPTDYFPHDGQYSTINHAITIVGFHDDPTIENGGYWICKNSWGPYWGYNGFFNIEYESRNIGKEVCWVTIPTPLIADFTYTPGEIDRFTRITFTPIIDSTISSIWWDFDDGYYSDLVNPKHQYFENGQYTVTVTIKNTLGKTATKSRVLTIPSTPPDPDFSFQPQNPLTNEPVQFIDQTSGYATNYHWDFGDGTTSLEESPTHSYADDGTYTITLTIIEFGETHVFSKTIQVSNRPPLADFTYELDAEKNLHLTDLSEDLDGDIITWTWECSTGETSSEQNPIIYLGEGSFDITLTITDDDGASHSKTITIDTTYSEEEIDQQSTSQSTSQLVHGPSFLAQSFIPTKYTLTKLDLFLRMSNSFGALRIAITEDSPSGPELTSMLLYNPDIPNTQAWITFDFEDIRTTPGQTYYIVVSSPYITGYSGSYYLYISFLDPYPNGTQYTSNNYGTKWNVIYSRDLCFKIYGR